MPRGGPLTHTPYFPSVCALKPMRKHLRAPLRGAAARFRFGPRVAASPAPQPAGAVASGRRFVGSLLLLAALASACALIYSAAGPAIFPVSSISSLLSMPAARRSTESDISELSLAAVLERATMVDKTVILTTLNAAWASSNSVIDFFLKSFQIGDHTNRLLKHLIIVALDQNAYLRCKSIHIHCYALVTEGIDFSEEKEFMTDGYLEMMWRRIDFLRIILEMGYNFIFTDADVMWFRDPLPHFYPDSDFQIACDHFVGNSTDLRNILNGGFNYVKSTHKTREFYKFWFSSRDDYPGFHDQDVLNFIKHDPFTHDLGLNMRFLDTAYFGGICEPSRDFNKVCTMHANCCIGLKSKLNDLRVMHEDWTTYMSSHPSIQGAQLFTWRVPQNCSIAGVLHRLRVHNIT